MWLEQRFLAVHFRVGAMSPGVDDNKSTDAEIPTVTLARAGDIPHRAVRHEDGEHEHPHHHILIEPEEDRWRWRRKIRQNPRRLVIYRIAVGLVGVLLIALGLVSGPLPGPGGIPLVLLGLAVWSSEFWPAATKGAFWVAFFACCGLFGYLYLLALGIPRWVPGSVDMLLQRLPGL
jgi:Putative transmembrane protein (PGPGW)